MAVPDRVSMANSAEQLIYQAAVLLEEHRDSEGALSALAEAINVAGLSHRTLELIRAKTFRGELLMQLDRNAEAVPISATWWPSPNFSKAIGNSWPKRRRRAGRGWKDSITEWLERRIRHFGRTHSGSSEQYEEV